MRAILLPLLAVLAFAQQGDKLAPYYPTPVMVVDRMLKLGNLKPGEKMFDLGSGDGRIVMMAARKFKADSTGIELDDKLYEESDGEVHRLKLAKLAHIIHGDILKQDYS